MRLESRWGEHAKRDLAGMEKRDAARVIVAVDRLAETGHGDVTRLTAKGKEPRLKVGPWRVRFTVTGDRMEILRVLRRREDTYRD